MFDILWKIFKTGTVTKEMPLEAAPSRFRGKPIFLSNECTECGVCVASCPTGAIQFHPKEDSSELVLSYATCIFCGICAEVCETQMIKMTNEYRLATKNKQDLIQTAQVTVKPSELAPVGKGV
ncbi:4Fe-4S binding protein [Effusibacillus lacus]|uniref:Formate hydrogenlyase complex iron-sulfur subunit n=1 Tax=Effusibacillus lacus TaxID=1348429 RepID=A0A292YMW9_9BACL|nr:4Fe-4S binding protein [Effusibacillus lacus]TCS71219.1 NADH-quinone oxidoreductase subunit I [Effusibacillus lacus]GAX89845.1 formate hydrogenlyase complex iron-sulfur subunit [Effusibacillus lacus]